MSFLKRLISSFTSGGGRSSDSGIYVYIKITRSGEIVRLFLRRGYEISTDDEGRLFTRKLIIGNRSFERVEALLYFDKNYHVVDAEMDGGELSTEAEYLAQEGASSE